MKYCNDKGSNLQDRDVQQRLVSSEVNKKGMLQRSRLLIVLGNFKPWLDPESLKLQTSFPYFGVKLSCVCLMIAYRKQDQKSYRSAKLNQAFENF